MIAKTSFVAGMLLLGMSILTYGQEDPIQIAYVPEASIIIDGNLSDWALIDATREQIQNVYPDTKIYQLLDGRFVTAGPAQDGIKKTANLSASIRAFTDKSKIYLAVNVADDVLCFGESLLGYTYRDDAVEIIFDWGRHLKFRVTADYEGNTVIDGSDFYSDLPYPMLMEVMGVEAALAEGDAGYTVEVAVPIRALKLAGLESGQALGLTVKVFDNDKEGASGYLNLTGSKNEDGKEKLRGISLDNEDASVSESSAGWNQVRILGGNELVITVDGAGAVEEDRVVVEALKCTWSEDWDQAEAILKSLPPSLTITPILAKVQLTALWRGHTKSSETAIATLSKVANESDVNSLVQWATWAIAKELEHEKKFDEALETYKGSIARKDNLVVRRCYALSLIKSARLSFGNKDLLSAGKYLNEVLRDCKNCKLQIIEAENLMERIEWEKYLESAEDK